MFNPELVYKIRGIVFDVYNNIIGSWNEEVIENILFDVLRDKELFVERQKEFEVFYKGNRVGLYRTDLIVENKIVLELKTVPEVFALHQAQTVSYLKVTGFPLGMLINFGGPKLYIKIYPNNLSQRKVLNTNFDINKINLAEEDKKLIRPFLEISQEILEILGPGYFHQVYRRSFWDELNIKILNLNGLKRWN